jgi:hypothetical protein
LELSAVIFTCIFAPHPQHYSYAFNNLYLFFFLFKSVKRVKQEQPVPMDTLDNEASLAQKVSPGMFARLLVIPYH